MSHNRKGTDDSPIPATVPTSPTPDIDIDYANINKQGIVGAGNSSIVYEATVKSRSEQHRIAIKEIILTEDHDAGNEARLWSQLDDNRYIVDIVDWGTTDRPWIAMEYMTGGDLQQRIEDGIPPVYALWIGFQLTKGLYHAHSHGIAHLDITPHNILFQSIEDGSWDIAKIADWGLSRQVLDQDTGIDGVTPRYAAPEQFAPDTYGHLDKYTDIYQSGVVMYELLTGKHPHPDRIVDDDNISLAREPPPPTTINSVLPRSIDPVLQRALAPAKEDRYASALDFCRDIEQLLQMLLSEKNDIQHRNEGYSRASNLLCGIGRVGTEIDTIESSSELITGLETQGFVKLRPAYFEQREPAPPTRSWRTGLRLADIAAGHAVDRNTPDANENVSISEKILEKLIHGTDVALTGPSGCGKTTICKKVTYEWFDQNHGEVFYWGADEPGQITRPVVLEQALQQRTEPVLVVVEEATTSAANAALEVAESFTDRSDLVFLFEARDTEWNDVSGIDIGAHINAYRYEEVEVVTVANPDEEECRRFIRKFEHLTDHPVKIHTDQFLEALQSVATTGGADAWTMDESQSYDLLITIQWLAEYAEAHDDAGDPTPNKLSEIVAKAHKKLAEAGDQHLQVGILIHFLNAAGIGVRPELLHTFSIRYNTDVVITVLDQLIGQTIFLPAKEKQYNSKNSQAYDTVQEAWSVEFLETLINREGSERAHELFAATVSTILTLAGNVEFRKCVRQECPGRAPYLDYISREPVTWQNRIIKRLFALGREWPRLTPLFGNPDDSQLELPEGCPLDLRLRCLQWHGQACYAADQYDQATNAFQSIQEILMEEQSDHDATKEILPEEDRVRWRARSQLGLGRIAWSQSNYDTAISHLISSLDMFRELDDIPGKGRALKNLGIAQRKRGNYEEAAQYQDQSLQIARDINDTQLEGEALNESGTIAALQGDYDAAEKHYKNGIACRRETGDRRGVATILNNLAILMRQKGNLAAAEERYRRALVIHDSIGNDKGVAKCLNGLGVVAVDRNALDCAAERLSQALEIHQEIGERHSEASTLINLGLVSERRGELTIAQNKYKKARDICQEIGDQQNRALCLRNLGEIAHIRADIDAAEEQLDRSLELYRAIDDTSGVARALAQRAIVALKRDALTEATEYARQSVRLARDTGDRLREAKGLDALGRIELNAGKLDSAEDHLRQGRNIWEEMELKSERARCLSYLGAVMLRKNLPDAASNYVDQAASVADNIDDPYTKGLVKDQHAMLARRRGDEERALKLYEQALEWYRTAEAVFDELRVLRVLVDLYSMTDAGSEARSKCEIGLRLAKQQGVDHLYDQFQYRYAGLMAEHDPP
jgi:serine/threonine protein kinase/tetratricopeptide (TPR) repeat protein